LKNAKVVDAPALCDQLAEGRFTGVRYFEEGEFVGIKVIALHYPQPDAWPFREGDILLDTVRCPPNGCTPQSFVSEVQRICRASRDRLLHDLRLDVRSRDAARTQSYLLRRAD
jgi:hypothetical protein